MAIWNIDGIMEDSKGRRYEDEFNINLLVCNKGWIGVQLDVEITPIFCMNCNKQVDGFFKHAGSRYGQVGNVYCNHCGSVIYCNDNDNIVNELLTYSGDEKTELIINYHKLYRLEQDIWKSLKEKNKYDIFAQHEDNEWTTLKTVINEICSINNIKFEDIPSKHIVTDNKITILPSVVIKWLNLIDLLVL